MQLGTGSSTTTLIPRSDFNDLESAIVSAKNQFPDQVKKSFLTFIGIEPRDPRDLQVIEKLIGPEVKHILVEDGVSWETNDPRVRTVSLQNQTSEAIQFLMQAKANSEPVIYIGPVIYVSQYMMQGPSLKIRQSFAANEVATIILNNLPRNRAEEKYVRIPCVVSTIDEIGTGALGCFSLQFARKYYAKPSNAAVVMGLEQIDDTKELILMYQ